MQNAETGTSEQSGASVQCGPDVVVCCDRCPRELERAIVDGFAATPTEYKLRWTQLAVQTGVAPAKLLTLCPECTRSLRLFLLGATTHARSWESLMSGAV